MVAGPGCWNQNHRTNLFRQKIYFCPCLPSLSRHRYISLHILPQVIFVSLPNIIYATPLIRSFLVLACHIYFLYLILPRLILFFLILLVLLSTHWIPSTLGRKGLLSYPIHRIFPYLSCCLPWLSSLALPYLYLTISHLISIDLILLYLLLAYLSLILSQLIHPWPPVSPESVTYAPSLQGPISKPPPTSGWAYLSKYTYCLHVNQQHACWIHFKWYEQFIRRPSANSWDVGLGRLFVWHPNNGRLNHTRFSGFLSLKHIFFHRNRSPGEGYILNPIIASPRIGFHCEAWCTF